MSFSHTPGSLRRSTRSSKRSSRFCMDWPSCSSSRSASAALVLDSSPWERDGAGRRPSRRGPWSYALSSRCIPPVGTPSSLRLTHSSVPSRTGTPAASLLCSPPERRSSKLCATMPQPFLKSPRRCCFHFSASGNFSPLPGTPADLIALLVRLRVNLGLASSSLTQSDSLAIVAPNSLKSES